MRTSSPFLRSTACNLESSINVTSWCLNTTRPRADTTTKPCIALQADGHIYTLNHNLDRLTHQDQESESEDNIKPRVGETSQIKDEVEARRAKMITTIDDILEVVRDMLPPAEKGDKQIITLIHRDDDLLKVLYQFVEAGYSPGVNFESGRVTALKLEVNNMFASSKPSS